MRPGRDAALHDESMLGLGAFDRRLVLSHDHLISIDNRDMSRRRHAPTAGRLC